ncbi:MAG: FAD-dependent oxidoreductase [Alkalispirochaeta sp.]
MAEKKQEFYDVVVVGGGPAGLTAAIYAGRARLKTLLIEKSLIGGLATYTSEIANYPGFPEGIDGGELTKLFDKQMRAFDVDVKLTDVKEIRTDCDSRVVSTFRTDYYAKAVVVATGGKSRLTGAKNEENFLSDKGISFCATCDAARYTDKTVMIIGSGDAAIEEGMFLTRFAKEVIVSVIHDEGVMDANRVAQDQAEKNPKMSFLFNTVVDSFEGGDMLERVVLKNIRTGELQPVDVDGCFLFIGYVPNTKVLEGFLTMTDRGYVRTNELMETNVPGVFAAGDCREKMLRQVATSVGDGAIAGVMAERYINEMEYVQNEILNAKGLRMVMIYDASESVDREFLARLETLQREHEEKFQIVRIDVYKSDKMACMLDYEVSPSLFVMVDGQAKEYFTDLSALSDKVAAAVDRYVAPSFA